LALNVEWIAAEIYTDGMRCGHLRRSDAFWTVKLGSFEHGLRGRRFLCL